MVKILFFFVALINNSISIILQGKLETSFEKTPLTSNIYVTIPLCFGLANEKKQCVRLIYDINEKIILIGDIGIHKTLGYNKALSTTIEDLNKSYSIGLGENRTLLNHIYRETLFFDEKHILYSFNFLLIENSTFSIQDFSYSGVAGFGYNNRLGENFTLIMSLYNEGIIKSRNFGHKFVDNENLEIFIGEEKNDEPKFMSSFEFCYMNQVLGKTESNFFCRLESMISEDYQEIIANYSASYVIFSTKSEYLLAPNPGGYDLFNLYIQASNGQCSLIKDTPNRSATIQCLTSFDISTLPVTYLHMRDSNLNIKLDPIDLFDSENKGRIYIRDFSSNWNLDLNILKHYDMYVNFNKAGVGFRPNNFFRKSKVKLNIPRALITLFFLLTNAFGIGVLGFYLYISGGCFRFKKMGSIFNLSP